MSREKDIAVLIHKYEERLEGLQAMAALEETTNYGTGVLTNPNSEGYELSLCIDALRVYRDKLLEDRKANNDQNPGNGALCDGAGADAGSGNSVVSNG